MQDEKRTPSRLSVPSRATRDLDSYVGGGSASVGPGEAPAVNVLGAVWRRKGAVVACVVLALAAGAVYLMRAAPLYSSSSVIYVQQAANNNPIFGASELQMAINSAGYLFTQCQLMTSTAILSRAIDVPGVADAKVLRGMENPVGYLRSVVSAVPTKQGDLIIVSMESPNPQDAATIVNGTVEAYIDYQSKQHQDNSTKVLEILRKDYKAHEDDLKAEQAHMLELRQKHPELNVSTNRPDAAADRLGQLGSALTEAGFRSDDLHTALNRASATDPNDLSSLRALIDEYKLGEQLTPSTLQQDMSSYQQLKAQRDSMADAGRGPGDDQMRRIQLAVDRAGAEVQGSTRAAEAACLSTIKAASTAADTRVAQLKAAADKQMASSQKLSAEETDYENQQELVMRNLHALDTLDERIKATANIKDVEPTTVTILETAKPVLEPVSPKKSRVLGMATAAGLLAGLGAALLFDKLDQRLRGIDEIAALLDASILGVIPRIVRRVLPGESGREIALRPRSGVAEAFRTVRTAIYFGGEERAVKTILVTSPTPGDGKSTCISNLAIAVAQAGRRVLLIDADCRRPVQHKTFGVPEGPGLTGVLTGKATLADAVHPTEIDRLDLLQCGPLPHNPAELLDSQALLDLLAEAGRKYDQVLIDSPPVTLVSDARVLAASCDASVLVLRAERSTRRGATLAWNALASVGANLLGVIVNDFSKQKDGYGYTYYGYGRYGYAPAAPAELANGNGHAADSSGNGNSMPVVTSASTTE